MAGRSRTTFRKREKELARIAKRREKEERREQRKLDKETRGPDSDIATAEELAQHGLTLDEEAGLMLNDDERDASRPDY